MYLIIIFIIYRGQEIPNVPLRIIIKDNIINFLKYGKYISLSEIYDIYQKNLQFHQNFESKKHSDYARLFGIFIIISLSYYFFLLYINIYYYISL